MGTTLVARSRRSCKGIEKLWELSNGGFGGLLFRATLGQPPGRRTIRTSCSRGT